MNAYPGLVDALQMAGLLAVEIAVVILATAAIQPFIRSAQWRRTIWQVCILTVTLISTLELSGIRQATANAFSLIRPSIRQPGKAAVPRRLTPAPAAEFATVTDFEKTQPQNSAPTATSPEKTAPIVTRRTALETVVGWLAFCWLLVTAALICRTGVMRITASLVHQRGALIQDPALTDMICDLSSQLGIRGGVRVVECSRLQGPVAFGLFRKAIGLPRGFRSEHSEKQQGVILAHELAHLAAHDAWWHLLAELAAALLWWHPLIWWAKRRLQQSSEVAADEASLLIQNGPPVLAECLVNLGRRLGTQQAWGWMHIDGFRSGLGRRVEGLLKLNDSTWRPPNRSRAVVAKIVCPTALVVVAILCSGWISPGSLTKGKNMKQTMWKRSLPAFAVLALLNGDQQLAAAEKTTQPVSTVAAVDSKPSGSRTNPLLARNAAPGQKRKGAEAIRKRLEQIVFDSVQYDSLPLGAVITQLIVESEKRDPDRIGVNFLLRNAAPDPVRAAIDPSTGLPIPASAPEPIDLNAVTIRIVPPLRNVRLIDILEAMVKVADVPITYSIEEYGVMFSLGSGSHSAQTLETRTFTMNRSDNFFKGIESAFGIKGQETSSPIPSRQSQQEIFQELFSQLGIDWAPPKSIFYNDLTGIVMVRAAAEDMPLITATIQTLGGTQTGMVQMGVPMSVPMSTPIPRPSPPATDRK